MSENNYPNRIDRLAKGALSQMGDYFRIDIETHDDVAMLEDRALGTAAKLVYFNTIRRELRMIACGERSPADGLSRLDTVARGWSTKGTKSRDRSTRGAAMACALSARWRNWIVGGTVAKERAGFVDHFGLRASGGASLPPDLPT